MEDKLLFIACLVAFGIMNLWWADKKTGNCDLRIQVCVAVATSATCFISALLVGLKLIIEIQG